MEGRLEDKKSKTCEKNKMEDEKGKEGRKEEKNDK